MTQPRGHLNDGFAVYTQEEVRLVRATAILFDFDLLPNTSSVSFGPTVLFERLTVPVYEGSKKVGAASLFATARKVMALLSFDYETPERFDLSIDRPVYAIPCGACYIDYKGPDQQILDYVDITGIELSYQPPETEGRGSALFVTKYDEIES
jgi:hypothetical protein